MAAATSSVTQQLVYNPNRTVGQNLTFYKTLLSSFINTTLKKEGHLDPRIYSAIDLFHAVENVNNVVVAHQNTLMQALKGEDIKARVTCFAPLIEGLYPPNELDPRGISAAAINIINMNVIPGWIPKLYYLRTHLIFLKNRPFVLDIYGRFQCAPNKAENTTPVFTLGGEDFKPLDVSETQLKFDVTSVVHRLNLSPKTCTVHEGSLKVPYLSGTTRLQRNTLSNSYYNLRFLAYPTQVGEIKAFFEEMIFDKITTPKYTSGTFSFDGRTYQPTDALREERFTIHAEPDCTIDVSEGKKIEVEKLQGCSGIHQIKADVNTLNTEVNVVVSLRTKQTEGDSDDRGVVSFIVKFDQKKKTFKKEPGSQEIGMGWNEELEVRSMTKLEYRPFNRKPTKLPIEIKGDYQSPFLNVKKTGEIWTIKTPYPVPYTPVNFK